MQFVGSPPADRRILRLIGSGGMGVVYEALDERLDRRVALKVLHPHLTIKPEMRDRLMKEARLAARVEHTNIVRIYNVHEVDTGLCLEMEYVDGVPLSQLLAGQPLSPSHAVDLLQQVLEALAVCHRKEIVHADLKPANLLITQEGKVLLTDFGIARAVFSEDGNAFTTLTLSGPMWGTPQYCPPEVWAGDLPNPTWDLYALGVLVHEALCGSLPFAAETPALLIREKLDGERTPIGDKRTDLSTELARLIDSLSANDPAARPESAVAALDALRQTPEFRASTAATKPLQHNETAQVPSGPLSIMRVSTPSADAGAHRRGVGIGLALGACAVLLLGLVGYAVWQIVDGEDSVTEIDPPIAAKGDVGEVLDLTVKGEIAVFSYDDGEHGRELWMATWAGEVGMVADINRGPGSSNPHGFLAHSGGGSFLLAAETEEFGEEPWIAEFGQGNYVRPLSDLLPGPMPSGPLPVAAYEKQWFFFASRAPGDRGMWISDGHHERTGLVREFQPEAAFLDNENERYTVDDAGMCTVWAKHRVRYLMRYDFADGSISNLGEVNRDVGDIAVLGERFVFAMYDEDVGYELWVTDRSGKGPRILRDIWPGSESSYPTDFYVWNDEVYFRASTHDEGSELWKSDGTEAGTVLVHDINPGPFDGSPSNFVGTRDRLFFRAEQEKCGEELFATSGEAGSEVRVHDIWPGVESSTPYSLAHLTHHLFFSADDGIHGEELWALHLDDANNVPFLVKDIREGPESSEPHSTQPLGAHKGIFIYHTADGPGLMRIVGLDGVDFELVPYGPLPLAK